LKAAFHFNVGNNRFGNPYDVNVENLVFSSLHIRPALSISSKIYAGDLLLHLASADDQSFNEAATKWIESARNGWNELTKQTELLFQTDVYIVCFDAVDKTTANLLHERLSTNQGYLAAIEINDADEFHWQFYSDALVLRYRLAEKQIAVFSDAFGDQLSDEEKEEAHTRFIKIGFQKVGFASSEGKHSVFDKYHSFEQARRVAEWRDKFGEMLGFVADNVITRLGDAAPKLGGKLWAAYSTFARSETNEELAQVCVSCRRIINYVADTLFPPRETQTGDRNLGAGNYRNRLMAFAEDQAKSGTNIDVICSSLELLEAHLEKLDQLANKGVHDEVTKEGTPRCLLRTVMLLDDIISLRPKQFQIKTELDFSMLDPKDER
jgi:hypothetical protein